jgi:hypothetical protein
MPVLKRLEPSEAELLKAARRQQSMTAQQMSQFASENAMFREFLTGEGIGAHARLTLEEGDDRKWIEKRLKKVAEDLGMEIRVQNRKPRDGEEEEPSNEIIFQINKRRAGWKRKTTAAAAQQPPAQERAVAANATGSNAYEARTANAAPNQSYSNQEEDDE